MLALKKDLKIVRLVEGKYKLYIIRYIPFNKSDIVLPMSIFNFIRSCQIE